ncbi:Hypothetical predicted protein, partial [Olea europaea subsp. europaea]
FLRKKQCSVRSSCTKPEVDIEAADRTRTEPLTAKTENWWATESCRLMMMVEVRRQLPASLMIQFMERIKLLVIVGNMSMT